MKLVVFGLTITSSWGNGHATLWRGLCKALAERGHRIVFFERDVPYYAGARDYCAAPGTDVVLYPDWAAVSKLAGAEIADADVVVVTSYCADAIAATAEIMEKARGTTIFYDMDTPVTLARLRKGLPVAYIGPDGLAGFDLVLSFTGGASLDELSIRLGARRVAPLYGHVDPDVHAPAPPQPHYRAALSYLGTYAPDRQSVLEQTFVEPARRRADQRFLIGGAQYPDDFPWSNNIYFVRHLPPSEHPAFFCSSRLTLNVTRAWMAESGWCPSGRLFEAAACQTAVLTDPWPGLEDFFTPGAEILLTSGADDTLASLDIDDAEIARLGRAARERVLDEHTSRHRASTFERFLASHEAPIRQMMEA
jgi:spore maturation protein CgeB